MPLKMHPEIEKLYEFLKAEVTWIHGRWIIFEQLYNTSKLRVDLLNQAASTFFYVLQYMMLDDLQLALGRLTDERRDTGSLVQLHRRLKRHADVHLVARAQPMLDALLLAVANIRDRRDKLIAHYSLDQATNPHAAPLPDVVYSELADGLRLVREYMNLVEAHHCDGMQQGYEHFIMDADGDTLVLVLKWGLRYQQMMLDGKVAYDHLVVDNWSNA